VYPAHSQKGAQAAGYTDLSMISMQLSRALAAASLALVLCGCERMSAPRPPRRDIDLPGAQLAAATVHRLKIPELGVTGKGPLQVQAEGAVVQAALHGDELRLLTPGDTGHAQEGRVLLSEAGTTWRLPLTIQTLKPDASAIPPDERIEGQDIPDLTVSGLGPGNTLQGQDLVFSLERVGPLDPKESQATLYVPSTRQSISLGNWWYLRRGDNALVIRKERLRQLLKGIPQGEYQLSVGLVTAEQDFGMGYTFFVQRADASLTGSVLTRKGKPLAALAGRPVIVRGIDNRIREVLFLDEQARFSIDGLVPGLYHVELVDLANPGRTAQQVPVYHSSREIEAVFVLDPSTLFRRGQPPIAYALEKGQKPPFQFPLPELDGTLKSYVKSPFRELSSTFFFRNPSVTTP